MGDPRERQEALNAELAASRRALQNARQKAKRAAKAQSALWCLAPELKRVASIAYDLAECVAEPSVRFLNDAAGKREWPEKGQQEVQAVVEALFLAADAAEVASLTDPSEPADQHAFREAAKHMQEWRVVAWARSCNAQQGVAPSTEALLQRVEEERRRLPEAARPPPRGSGAEAKGRMWASRLRVRGGGTDRFGSEMTSLCRRWGARSCEHRVSRALEGASQLFMMGYGLGASWRHL